MSKAGDATPFGTDVAFREVFSTEDSADPLALFESEVESEVESKVELARTGEASARQQPSVVVFETRDAIAEAGPAAAPSLGPGAVSTHERGPIALDHVLDRLGYVVWAEAVAIVDALCATLTHATGRDASVPELSQISMTAQGTILIGGGAVTGSPGPRLARTLHALTASGAIPVPLRLFITKWISFTEEHSIPEFAKELAYFARPNGTSLIQAVYERVAAAPSPQLKSQPVESDAARADQPRRPRLRRLHWLAASVLVAGTAAVSMLEWRGVSTPPGQGSTFSFTSLLEPAADVAGRVGVAVGERVGLAGLSGSAGSAPRAQEEPSTPSAPARESTLAARSAPPQRTSTRIASIRPTAIRSLPVTRDARDFVPDVSAVAPAASLLDSVPSDVPQGGGPDGVSDESPIYSDGDSDVKPPVLRHPQLPAPLLVSARAEVNTIELIISEAGTVERVRLLSQPRRMADMMLLSGAKTWEFEPASRLGQSVRYRVLLSWDATP